MLINHPAKLVSVRIPLVVASMLAIAAASPAVKVENPVIDGTVARATITTPTDDAIEGVSSPGGIAMLHASRLSSAVMVRAAIPFKAGSPRTLSKFGYHVMLMHKLPVGSSLPITLIFKNAGAVKVTFRVAS